MAGSVPTGTELGSGWGAGTPGSSLAKECVEDVVHQGYPTSVPIFVSLPMAPKKPHDTLYTWIEDNDLNEAAGDLTGAAEGADHGAALDTVPARASNFLQIFRPAEDIAISGTAMAIDYWGVKNRTRYMIRRQIQRMRIAFEKVFFSPAGSGQLTDPRRMKSINDFITLEGSGGTGYHIDSTSLGGGGAATTTFEPITPAQVNALAEIIVTKSDAMVRYMWVHPSVKTGIGETWVNYNQTNVISATDKRLVMDLRVLDTPHGLITILTSRHVPKKGDGGDDAAGQVYLTDGKSVQKAFLRSLDYDHLGKQGDNERFMVLMEGTCKAANADYVMGRIYGVDGAAAS